MLAQEEEDRSIQTARRDQSRTDAAWMKQVGGMEGVGKGKGMVLYSAVSSPLDRSKRFTLHPLADLFIPTPTRLLLEEF